MTMILCGIYIAGYVIAWWPMWQAFLGHDQRSFPSLRAEPWGCAGFATFTCLLWPMALLAIPVLASMWLWRGRRFTWSPDPERSNRKANR